MDATQDVALLTQAVTANPQESAAAGSLFDALQESGLSPAKARRLVNDAIRQAAPEQWPAKMLRGLIRGTTLDALRASLDRANGRRRERTLTLHDVLRCVQRAREDGWHAVGGGTVANAYSYPAEQTACLVAVRTDGTVRVAIGTTGAKKGNSLTNWASGLTIRSTAEQFRAWADTAEIAPAQGG